MKNEKPSYEELERLYQKQTKRFNAILKLSDSQALKLIRMTEEKSAFLANMSHELRTPLNAIIGFSHILQNNEAIQKEHKDYIDKINTSGNQLLHLINSILDFSKIEAGKTTLEYQEFNLLNTIRIATSQIELKAQEKNLDVVVNYADDIHKVFMGDSLRISQILVNLLGNAVKFTNTGRIELTITKNKRDNYRFEVKDTGIGLTEEQKHNIFRPFSQADVSTTRNYGGTGLGLSISKELIKLMDGSIWVESELGKGSNFFFEIELKEVHKKEERKVDLQENVVDRNSLKTLAGKRILYAEDNITNQLVLKVYLKNSGIEIDVVNNGEEAVAKARDNEYELILMDLEMPILDGYQAAKIIKETKTDIPIVMLTARATKEDADKSEKLGLNGHLNKPIEVDKLYDTLFKYLSN